MLTSKGRGAIKCQLYWINLFDKFVRQYLGKNKFVDLRLSEAIFEKEDKTFIIIDYNNQIREANEY